MSGKSMWAKEMPLGQLVAITCVWGILQIAVFVIWPIGDSFVGIAVAVTLSILLAWRWIDLVLRQRRRGPPG